MINGEIQQAFYCSELTYSNVGVGQVRASRSNPNDNWPISGGPDAITCTEWHSYQGDSINTLASGTISHNPDVYHADIMASLGLIIFALFIMFFGLIFNSFFKRN